MNDLRRRLSARPWTWAVVAVAVVIFLVVGLGWVDGLRMRTAARETWAERIIIVGGLGLFVVEAARRLHRWVGLVAAIGLAVVVFVGLGVIVDEIRLEEFGEGDRRPLSAAPPQEAAVTAAPPATGLTARADWDALDVGLEPVLTGLTQPVAVAPVPATDRFVVLQREGEIRLVAEGDEGGELLVDLGAETTLDGERGMYDVAIGPADGRLYVSFSDTDGDNRVISFAMAQDGTLDDRQEIIEVTQPFETHNGGGIAFDAHGYLLVAVGDGGRLRDPLGAGQDRSNRLSTVLRIDALTTGGYEIPADNPYLDDEGTWPEIYAFGLRNPWRLSTDPLTGDIWIGDVGQDGFEEINRIPFASTGGSNFGWSITEGAGVHVGKPNAPTGFTEADVPADHVEPVFFYAHDPDGIEGARNSVTGGHVYRGDAIDALAGTYVYADFSASLVGAVLVDGDAAAGDRLLFDDAGAIVSIGVDHGSELLLVSLGGEVSRIVER